jgi:predicted DNA-binding ribbon-helix-helix protein
VASIDTERHGGNLSSAIRLFVLDHYRAQLGDRLTGSPSRQAGGAHVSSVLGAD